MLPYLHGLHLEAEDALAPSPRRHPAPPPPPEGGKIRIIVPALLRISNHTDFDPLRLHPQVDLRFIGPGEPIPGADLVILPGSKNTRADLAWLRAQGWEEAIRRHLRYGGKLIGLCGGFQMLGRAIHDPHGVDGAPGTSAGLGLLEMETVMEGHKRLARVRGRLALGGGGGADVEGYEIHMGRSTGPALARPAVQWGTDGDGGTDGALSEDGQILGTYLHGLFDRPEACRALLAWAGLTAPSHFDYRALREAGIERLADAVEQHLDTARLLALLEPLPRSSSPTRLGGKMGSCAPRTPDTNRSLEKPVACQDSSAPETGGFSGGGPRRILHRE